MAALPYMQLYVADYLADTSHLTTEEHGAYLLLLFSYWQTGKPLRADRLASVARLSSERWANAERTLKEFFHVENGVWTHKRVEADLEKVGSKSRNNSEAGKKSALARALAKQALAENETTNAATNVSTNVERTYQRNVNHARSRDTDTDTDTEQVDQERLSPSSPKPKRNTKIPEPFLLTVDMRKWAAEKAPGVDARAETENFVDYWRGAGKTKADWIATWRTWMRKAQQDVNRSPGRGGMGGVVNRQQQIEDASAAVVRQIQERELLRQQQESDVIGHGDVISPGGEVIYVD